jgi:hypothetical protein
MDPKNQRMCNISSVTNDARCTRETKSSIAMAKTVFNKKALFTKKLDLNLRINSFCNIFTPPCP